MKLYTSMGPNPAVVAMFLAEKGAQVPTEKVDLMAGENRQPPYVARTRPASCPAWSWTTARTWPRSPPFANTSTRSSPARR